MDRAVALARLGRMVASDQRPALSAEDLGALLDEFQTVDSDGRRPTDDGWTGAWNLNAAAAEGWRRKAGKVAGDFTFGADGANYNKGEVLAQIERMVVMYAARDVGTATIAKAERGYDTERLFLNG
jgi:hypothetical protein